MKLHLPTGLRKAVLACLAALVAHAVPLTVSTGAAYATSGALVTFLLGQQANADAPTGSAGTLTSETTTVDGITFSGRIFTATGSNTNVHGTTYHQYQATDRGELYDEDVVGDSQTRIDGVHQRSATAAADAFWRIWTNNIADVWYGHTMRLDNTTANTLEYSFAPFAIGGLISEDKAHTITASNSTDRALNLAAATGCNVEFLIKSDMIIKSYNPANQTLTATLWSDANWHIADGATLTWNGLALTTNGTKNINITNYSNSGTANFVANNLVTLNGTSTLTIGNGVAATLASGVDGTTGAIVVNEGGSLSMSGGAIGSLTLNDGSKLTITGSEPFSIGSLIGNGTIVLNSPNTVGGWLTITGEGSNGTITLDLSGVDLFLEEDASWDIFSDFGAMESLVQNLDFEVIGIESRFYTVVYDSADGKLHVRSTGTQSVFTWDGDQSSLTWGGEGETSGMWHDYTGTWIDGADANFSGAPTEGNVVTVTLGGNIQVRRLTVDGAAEFTFAGAHALTIADKLVVGEHSTVTIGDDITLSFTQAEVNGQLNIKALNATEVSGLTLTGSGAVSFSGLRGNLLINDAELNVSLISFSKADGVESATVTISNALTITNQQLNFTGLDVAINGLLKIGGTGSLNVDGSLTLNSGVVDNNNNRIHIYGPANREGDADTWAPTLRVTNDLTIATGALWVCSGSSGTAGDTNVEVGNDLTITGGGLVVGGSGGAKSRLHVVGDVSLGGNIHTGTASEVAKIGTGGGNPNGGYLIVDGSLTSTGTGTFIVGETDSTQKPEQRSHGVVTIGVDMTLAGALNIVGSTTYANSVTVGNDLRVSGTTTVGGTLTVNGDVTLSGDLVMDSGVFTVNARTGDDGDVDNSLTLSGSTRIGNTWSTGTGAYTSQLITGDGVDVIISGSGVVNMNGGKNDSTSERHVHFTVGGTLQASQATLNLMATEVILKQGGQLGTLNIAAVNSNAYHTTIALGGDLEISAATIGDTGASFSRYDADATPETVYVVWNAGDAGTTMSVGNLGLSGITLNDGVGIAKKGSGTLTLSDTGTIASSFRVMQGALALAGGDTTFSAALTIDSTGRVEMGSEGILSVGSLMGSGTIALGALRETGGWLAITGSGSSGTITLDLTGFEITEAGNYDLFSNFAGIESGWLSALNFRLTGYDDALWTVVYNATTGQLNIIEVVGSKNLVWKGLTEAPADGYVWAATGDEDLEWTDDSNSGLELAYNYKNDGTYNVSFTAATAGAIAVSGDVRVNNMDVAGNYTFTGAEGDSITVNGALNITSGKTTLGVDMTVEGEFNGGSGQDIGLVLAGTHLTLMQGGTLGALDYRTAGTNTITLGSDLTIDYLWGAEGADHYLTFNKTGEEEVTVYVMSGAGIPSTNLTFDEGVNADFTAWTPGGNISKNVTWSIGGNLDLKSDSTLKIGEDGTRDDQQGHVHVHGNMNGNSVTILPNANSTLVVDSDLTLTGTLTANGGTVTVAGTLTAGTINVDGGTLTIANSITVASLGKGTFNRYVPQDGGDVSDITVTVSGYSNGFEKNMTFGEHVLAQFGNFTATAYRATLSAVENVTFTGYMNVSSGTVNVGKLLTVGGNLTLAASGEYTDGEVTAGSLSVTGTTTVSAGSLTVNGAANFTSLTKSNTSSLTVGGELNVSGTMTLSGTGDTILKQGGSIGTLAYTGSTTSEATIMQLGGDLEIATLARTSGPLTFNAYDNAEVTVTIGDGIASVETGTVNFGDGVSLVLDSAVTFELRTVLNVNGGDMTVNGALTNTGNAQITVSGTLTAQDGLTQSAGAITVGTLDAASTTVELSGGTLTVNTAGSIGTLSGTGGTLTVGGTLNVTNTTATLTRLTLNGTLKMGTSDGSNYLALGNMTLGEGATLALTGLSVYDDATDKALIRFISPTTVSSSLELNLDEWDVAPLLEDKQQTYEFALFSNLSGLTISNLEDFTISLKDGSWGVVYDEGKLIFSYKYKELEYEDTITWIGPGDSTWSADDTDPDEWLNNENAVTFKDHKAGDGAPNVLFGTSGNGPVTVEGTVRVNNMTVNSAYTFNAAAAGTNSIAVGGKLTATADINFNVDTTVAGNAEVAGVTVGAGKTLEIGGNATFSAKSFFRGNVIIGGTAGFAGGESFDLIGGSLTLKSAEATTVENAWIENASNFIIGGDLELSRLRGTATADITFSRYENTTKTGNVTVTIGSLEGAANGNLTFNRGVDLHLMTGYNGWYNGKTLTVNGNFTYDMTGTNAKNFRLGNSSLIVNAVTDENGSVQNSVNLNAVMIVNNSDAHFTIGDGVVTNLGQGTVFSAAGGDVTFGGKLNADTATLYLSGDGTNVELKNGGNIGTLESAKFSDSDSSATPTKVAGTGGNLKLSGGTLEIGSTTAGLTSLELNGTLKLGSRAGANCLTLGALVLGDGATLEITDLDGTAPLIAFAEGFATPTEGSLKLDLSGWDVKTLLTDTENGHSFALFSGLTEWDGLSELLDGLDDWRVTVKDGTWFVEFEEGNLVFSFEKKEQLFWNGESSTWSSDGTDWAGEDGNDPELGMNAASNVVFGTAAENKEIEISGSIIVNDMEVWDDYTFATGGDAKGELTVNGELRIDYEKSATFHGDGEVTINSVTGEGTLVVDVEAGKGVTVSLGEGAKDSFEGNVTLNSGRLTLKNGLTLSGSQDKDMAADTGVLTLVGGELEIVEGDVTANEISVDGETKVIGTSTEATLAAGTISGGGVLANAAGNANTLSGNAVGFTGTIKAADTASWTLEGKLKGAEELGLSLAGDGKIIVAYEDVAAEGLAITGKLNGELSIENKLANGAALILANGPQKVAPFSRIRALADEPGTASGTLIFNDNVIRLGTETKAGAWAGAKLAGEGEFVLVNGTLEQAVTETDKVNVSVDAQGEVNAGGTASSKISAITIHGDKGGKLTNVDGDIVAGDIAVSLVLGVQNIGDSAKSGESLIGGSSLAINEIGKGGLTLDFNAESFVKMLKNHRQADYKTWLHLTDSKLTATGDLNGLLSSGYGAILDSLGFNFVGADGGALVIAGTSTNVYLALNEWEGEEDAKSRAHEVQGSELGNYLATVVDEGVELTVIADEDTVSVNNLVGLKDSVLHGKKADGQSEVTIDLTNSAITEDIDEPGLDHAGELGTNDVKGHDTSFAGLIKGDAGVNYSKSGAGTLTVGAEGSGGIELEGSLTLTDGGIVLQGSDESRADEVIFAYIDGAEEKGLEVTNDATLTVNGLRETNEQGGEVSLTKKGALVINGASELHSTSISSDGSGALTVNDELTLADDATVSGGTLTISKSGTVTVTDGSSISPETVKLDGTLDISTSKGNTLNSLSGSGTLAGGKGSELTLNGESSFTGTLDGSRTGTANGHKNGGGSLIVAKDATLDLSGAKSTDYVWNAKVQGGASLTVDMTGRSERLDLDVTLEQGAELNYTFNANENARLRGNLIVNGEADLNVEINGIDTTSGAIVLGLTLTEGDLNNLTLHLEGTIGSYLDKSTFTADADGKLTIGGVKKAPVNMLYHDGMAKNAAAGAKMMWNLAEHAWSDMDSDLFNYWVGLVTQGSEAAMDRSLAGLAGASVSVLGAAVTQDLVRQLNTIRNRTTMMSDSQVNADPGQPEYHMWINAESAYHKMDADGLAPGFTLNGWGGTVGTDVQLSSNVCTGIALTAMYNDLKTESADNGRGDIDTTYLSAFVRVADGAWTHTFVATAGMVDVNLNRTVSAGNQSFRTHGETDGYALGVMYEVGYTFMMNEAGTFAVQPIANVQFKHTALKGYTEGGSGVALRVNDISHDVVTLGAGARMQKIIGENAFNRASILEARALVKVDMGDRSGSATTSLMPGLTSAEVESARVGRVGIELGAGVSVPLDSNSSSVFADGSLELRPGYSSMNASVGYRMSF